ncbi:MAG: 6-hydroxynicotinate reductase [Alphaproteobacteria bacterium]
MTTATSEKIRCDACPVMCYIADGQTGACDRYGNQRGRIVRCDPLIVLEQRTEDRGEIVPFLNQAADWDGEIINPPDRFVTAIGAGTTYPDYKPAPFIVSREVDGVDMVTVVTEGIFSYCGVKVKVDTDRHLGPETATIRVNGEAIGHVTTAEYGSQMLSLGGVRHLTGGTKSQGRTTCQALLDLCNCQPVELTVDGGSTVIVQAGQPPIVDGRQEARMRVGCGSATIGMFATQWYGLVDEVVVVDDHITGVVSEHQAGKVLGWTATGIKIKGRRSTPGRYFKVAEPGSGWGGADIDDPLDILGPFDPKKGAKPGLTILMVSTTGEQYSYYILDDQLAPVRRELPENLRKSVGLINENCEPALCTVLFMAGAGGSLRAGVTENPVQLTRSVQGRQTHVTCGGASVYVWPGGGVTIMVDVTRLPANAFGHVPTPALVAPIEFTMRRQDYEALGGHAGAVRTLDDILRQGGEYGADHKLMPSEGDS